MIKRLADNISSYLSRELNYDEEKKGILSFGLQIFLGALIGTISILILAYFLNIFKSTVIVLISFVIFRRLIGGSHCNTYKKCYFTTIIFMIVLGKLGEVIDLTSTYILILSILIYVLAAAATVLWVPAGTEKKMIKNIDTRRKIKVQTIMLLTIWILICNFLNNLSLYKYAVQSSLGVILAFFLVTPLGYRLINLKSLKTNLN